MNMKLSVCVQREHDSSNVRMAYSNSYFRPTSPSAKWGWHACVTHEKVVEALVEWHVVAVIVAIFRRLGCVITVGVGGDPVAAVARGATQHERVAV
jgi:hypothetical protein